MKPNSKLLIALTLAALLAAPGCTDPSAKLPNYGVVPRFQMIDSRGESFSSASLSGKVWIADFIYTNCPGPCPMMTQRMHQVQQKIQHEADVEIVSISVDPAHDSPPVLDAFAHRFHGPAPDWKFLTGSPQTVHLLAREVFKIGDVIPDMDHSTKFMIVDKQSNIRGYYSSLEEDGENGISQMLHDVESLRRQRL